MPSNKKQFSVGLTGGIGSGKSTVGALFVKHNITLVDTDQIARDVVAPGQAVLKNIQHHFGKHALLEDGHLNRSFIRERVFAQPHDKTWLNEQLHPLIRTEMQNQITLSNSPYCIVDVPLLTENNMAELFSRILVVDCSVELQLSRAMARDSNNEQSIKNIINAQASRAQRQAIADDIVLNNTDLQHLEQSVNRLHRLYLQLSQSN